MHGSKPFDEKVKAMVDHYKTMEAEKKEENAMIAKGEEVHHDEVTVESLSEDKEK